MSLAASETPLRPFLELCGRRAWTARLGELQERVRDASAQGRAARHRHALELALARMAAAGQRHRADQVVAELAQDATRLARLLPAEGRERLRARLAVALSGDGTLIPLFHLLRTARRARALGFEVSFPGLAEGAAQDLLLRRPGAEAEVVCCTIPADEGRLVSRGDWFALVDAINPELQTWLAAHPGRYLLKVTLPDGLAGPGQAGELHRQISTLLTEDKRHDTSAQAVLKLDPLILAGAQAAGDLPAALRAAFGPDSHLAVAANAGSVFVMAARAGRESGIPDAVTRAAAAAGERLSGRRAGIVAGFVDNLDSQEWRHLRETLVLEGVVRRWFTTAPAQPVAALSCATRFEMFAEAGGVAAGELRFRNPAHPAAKHPGLTPVLLSVT